MTPEQAFGKVLRELREARHLSQEALAELARCSRPHLSRLETGKNSPSLSMLFQLSEALEVAPDQLLALTRERLR